MHKIKICGKLEIMEKWIKYDGKVEKDEKGFTLIVCSLAYPIVKYHIIINQCLPYELI